MKFTNFAVTLQPTKLCDFLKESGADCSCLKFLTEDRYLILVEITR